MQLKFAYVGKKQYLCSVKGTKTYWTSFGGKRNRQRWGATGEE